MCMYTYEKIAQSEVLLNNPAFYRFLLSPAVERNLFDYSVTFSLISVPFMREPERSRQFLGVVSS